MSDSDHDELGKVPAGGRTMQLDALPEELVEGLTGEDSGYQLASEGGPSLPPPLPPKTSAAPPAASEAGGSKRTMILAVVVALLMAVAGVVVGTMVFGEEDAPPAEPPPAIELGDIEVDSH